MNVVTLIGNVATDVELRAVGDEQKVASFLLAVDRPGDKGADFVRVCAWNRQAEACARHLGKGQTGGGRRAPAQPVLGGARRQAEERRGGFREPGRVPRRPADGRRADARRGARGRSGEAMRPLYDRRRWRAATRSSPTRTSFSTSTAGPSSALPAPRSSAPRPWTRSPAASRRRWSSFARAGAAGAQMVLVHHGIYWRNEPLVVDRRQRGRLQALFDHDLTLAAYHLALDAHPELGNSAQLARRLEVIVEGPFERVGVGGTLAEPHHNRGLRPTRRRRRGPRAAPPSRWARQRCVGSRSRRAVPATRSCRPLARASTCSSPASPRSPTCTPPESSASTCVAAGHYATERLGVQALAADVAERFGVAWEFIELPNPV